MKNFSFKRYGAHLRCTLKQNAGMFAVFAFFNVLLVLVFSAYLKMGYGYEVFLKDTPKDAYFVRDFTPMFLAFVTVAYVMNIFSDIFFTIKNFKFLYSKRKVDFFLSLPVTREESFLSYITAAALFYAVLLLVQLAGFCVISADFPCETSIVLLDFMLSFVSGLFFVAVAFLCAVSEGTVVTFLVSSFCVYVLPYFSVSSFLKLLPEVFKRYEVNEYLSSILSLDVYITDKINFAAVFIAIVSRLVLFCVVVGFGAYAYKQRKSERSADMRLSSLTSFFIITDVFCFLMFTNKFVDYEDFLPLRDDSTYYYDFKPITLTSSLWYSLVAALIVTIVAVVLLRKNNADKKQIAFTSSAFGVVLLLAVFSVCLQNGAKKFDSYVPQVSEVEGVTITMPQTDSMGQEYAVYKADFTDAEMINKIVSYHRIDVEEDDERFYSSMLAEYHLKNGKTVKRFLGSASSLHQGYTLHEEILANPKLKFFEQNKSRKLVCVLVERAGDIEPLILFKGDDAQKLFSLLTSDDVNAVENSQSNHSTYFIKFIFEERDVPDDIIDNLEAKDCQALGRSGFYLKGEDFEINGSYEKSTQFIEDAAGIDFSYTPYDFNQNNSPDNYFSKQMP